MEPEYKLYHSLDILAPYGQCKFYKTNGSRSYVHRYFKWPYIDIWFFKANLTHVYLELTPEEGLLKSDIYPLMDRPFGNLMLSSPCNSSNILRDLNIEQCKSRSYSHVFEVPLYNWWQRVISCNNLYSNYPFVFRETAKGRKPYYFEVNGIGHQKEILQIGGRVINNATIYQPRCIGQRK